MMMTLSLALRNLLRNRRRSLATLLAMAIGSTATLLFGGFSANINYMMHTHHVRVGGHLQIQHRDFYLYGNGNPTAYGIADYKGLMESIRQDPVLGKMVLVVSPTMQFGGIAGNYAAGVSRTVIGNGFVAEDVNRMWLWNDFELITPTKKFALDGSPPDSAIVGIGVARVLQLCKALQIDRCPAPEATEKAAVDGGKIPDDIAQLSLPDTSAKNAAAGQSTAADDRRIEVLIGNARGAPNVTSLQVIRAEEQAIKELDEVYVMMHLDQLQKLIYGRSPPKVTSIMLQLQHSHQIPQAIERLEPILKKYSAGQPLAVLDFRKLNPFYVQTIGMFDTIFGFIFILIGGIVLFTVSNTMNTAVVERTVEIGTLRAIGLRRAGIRSLFVTEGALLGMSGAVLGVLLALLLSTLVNSLGLTWWPPGNVDPLPLTLTVWGETKMIIGTTLGLMVIAVVSAWWPAYRAAHLSVVDALRHV
jgi:putative ABC transport system permease protein